MKYYLVLVFGLMVCLGCSEPEQATVPNAGDADKATPVASQSDTEQSASNGNATEESGADKSVAVEGEPTGQAVAGNETDTEAETAVDATQILDSAIAKAKAENKALFVHFTADW